MTTAQLTAILASGEGHKMEFKRSINSDLSKEMVAFANASGGTIIIGINDDNTIFGAETNNTARSRTTEIANDCDPSIPVTLEIVDNVIAIHVPEGTDKPYRCTGGFYIRIGPNSVKLTRNEIISFIKTEGKVLFDELMVPEARVHNYLDAEAFDRYLSLAEIKAVGNPEILLHNLGVAESSADFSIFNNTGILFFATDPTRFIPQSAVTCVAYKGLSKVTIIDKKSFGFNLVRNIDEALSFLKRHLNVAFQIRGKKRVEQLEIPEVVLREAVVNAVTHRNYFEKGANVMIEIFDNRVEISNPGGLAKGLKPEDFGKRTLARNPLVAGLLTRTGYVEKLGTGVPRIRQCMAEADLPEPEFLFDDFFTVVLRRYNIEVEIKRELDVPGKRAARLAFIIRQLWKKEFNVESVATETGSTSRTIRNDLDLLIVKGWVTTSGSTKGKQYDLSHPGKETLSRWI